MRLENQVVIITASTRGIGYACVKACAREGAIVYMGARNAERAQAAIDKLTAKGFQVKYVYNDATDPESYQTMVDAVYQAEGRIDAVVNNFGTSDPRKDLDISHTDVQTFLETVEINLQSVFLTTKAVLPYMEKQKKGSIINISSIGGFVPDISQIGYGTSKAAINYLTKLIAVQEARHNIRCNAVLPGMTATDAVKDKLNDTFKELFLKNTPIKRMGLPEEIAQAVVYFASDASAYTTGQILAVSGGFGLATPVFGDLADLANARG